MEVVVQPDKDNKVWIVLHTVDNILFNRLLHKELPMSIHSFETR